MYTSVLPERGRDMNQNPGSNFCVPSCWKVL